MRMITDSDQEKHIFAECKIHRITCFKANEVSSLVGRWKNSGFVAKVSPSIAKNTESIVTVENLSFRNQTDNMAVQMIYVCLITFRSDKGK